MSGLQLGSVLSLALSGSVDEEEEEDEALPLPSADSPSKSPSPVSPTPVDIKLEDLQEDATRQPLAKVPLFAINLDEEEEEEEDMPLEPLLENSTQPVAHISQQFIDAQRDIQENPYDTHAWKTYIQEATHSRAGALTPIEAYSNLLEVFPKSARHWQALLATHIARDDTSEAEKSFARASAHKLRSVDLWLVYMDLMRGNSLEKKKCEELFESCLRDVGWAIDSGTLWRKYLDYISEIRDPTRLLSLRRIYQRALTIPMDALDGIWAEYEKLERSAGEHLADQLLPEFHDKYMRAKLVFKERKKLLNACDLDRLAMPPGMSASAELSQLDAWNRLLKSELKHADTTDEQSRHFLLMAHDQLLCCFRLHPEAWIAHAHFDLAALGVVAAKATFREAVEVLPSSELVRIAYADMEEEYGSVEGARDVLRSALVSIPTGLMFAAYQKFLRRVDGVAAARRLFSECLALGKKQDRPCDSAVFICHALMELHVNNEPQVALKTLELCKTVHKTIETTVPYVKALAQAMVRLGDHKEVQRVFANALEPRTSVIEEKTEQEIGKQEAVLSAKDAAELWEELFRVESDVGLCSLSRLGELRKKRMAATTVYEESLRGRALAHSDDLRGDVPQSILSIVERFESLDVLQLDSVDGGVRSRCSKLADSYAGRRVEHEREPVDAGKKKSSSRREDAPDTLPSVSVALKDLTGKLPTVPLMDMDVSGFIDHLRRIVLPPRPMTEESDAALVSSNKRFRNAMDENDVEVSRDDVFKTRQRARFGR